jgi:hypothetical protein
MSSAYSYTRFPADISPLQATAGNVIVGTQVSTAFHADSGRRHKPVAWLRLVGVPRGTRAPGRSARPPSWLAVVGRGSCHCRARCSGHPRSTRVSRSLVTGHLTKHQSPRSPARRSSLSPEAVLTSTRRNGASQRARKSRRPRGLWPGRCDEAVTAQGCWRRPTRRSMALISSSTHMNGQRQPTRREDGSSSAGRAGLRRHRRPATPPRAASAVHTSCGAQVITRPLVLRCP